MKYLNIILLIVALIAGYLYYTEHQRLIEYIIRSDLDSLEIANLMADKDSLKVIYQDSILTVKQKLGKRIIDLRDELNHKIESIKKLTIDVSILKDSIETLSMSVNEKEEVYLLYDSTKFYILKAKIHYLKGKNRVYLSDVSLVASANITIKSVKIDKNGAASVEVVSNNPYLQVNDVYSADNVTLPEVTVEQKKKEFGFLAGPGIYQFNGYREFALAGGVRYKKYNFVAQIGQSFKSLVFFYEF